MYNFNDSIKVKVTPHGEKIYDRCHEQVKRVLEEAGRDSSIISLPKDEEGFTFFQLWLLMSIFGEDHTETEPCCINLHNHLLKVKVTAWGETVYNQYKQKGHAVPPLVRDDEGYTSFRLLDIMRIFGPAMSMTSELCVEMKYAIIEAGQ